MSKKDRTRTHEWANPLELAAQAKTMSGFDFLKGILNGEIPQAPIAETLGFHPLSLEKGKAVFEFEPQEFHYNPIGSVHGGVITTVLDTVMGCSLQSALPQGVAYTTLELKVNFLKAVSHKNGKLNSTGKIIHLGKSTALVEADLKDEDGKIYAHGVSTCMLFNL
ncbi:PaaI family thioesterase [Epilithonimonas hungarica]|uniref:Uncharacterized domain 1-containing protein n=1 Tax=Epilithonimonas hungarica TaxID=454006 RepID=A0A1G7S4E7_9FLAO|nr:PaaI family thioesterase [Epilithonimonas hungarica]SDG17851.1 uncharacterized domain 1-containing protein [Epilithonimonas hungarica]